MYTKVIILYLVEKARDYRERQVLMRRLLKGFNYRLYIALLVLGFIPTIYTTVRVFFLGQLPGEWAFSIAGQLSWVNLFYEILNESIILPLFYFVGKVKADKEAFSNRVRTGLLLSFGLYALLSVIIITLTEPMLKYMAVDQSIVVASAKYIRIESVANVLALLMQFILVILVTIDKSRYLYFITGARLVLCLIVDTFLVSSLPISANLGVNGIGYSNIIVNVFLLLVAFGLLAREQIYIWPNNKLDFIWLKELARVGGVSGLESLVRNVAYMVMISRMVNVVGEQGTYWVANNFIWGWLLLPVIQLGELIKQEIAEDKRNIHRNSRSYFGITGLIVLLWFMSVPMWKPFMVSVLEVGEAEKVFGLVLILIGFYVFYAFQNVFDATFYGLGKTKYMLFESIVTNFIYYGIAFVLYVMNVWSPSLIGIALLFGFGNVFDSVVSFGAYVYMLKKEKIRI